MVEVEPPAPIDFRTLFADAKHQMTLGPGGVREITVAIDGPPLRARSRLITSADMTFIRGDNRAVKDLVLRQEQRGSLIALQTPLRGEASMTVDGLGPLGAIIGNIQLFAAPNACSTVRLRARVANEAFRITLVDRFRHSEPYGTGEKPVIPKARGRSAGTLLIQTIH